MYNLLQIYSQVVGAVIMLICQWDVDTKVTEVVTVGSSDHTGSRGKGWVYQNSEAGWVYQNSELRGVALRSWNSDLGAWGLGVLPDLCCISEGSSKAGSGRKIQCVSFTALYLASV